MTVKRPPNGYRDIYFRIVISLVAAHIIVTYGAPESIFELLLHRYYYVDVALSFVIAFLLVSEVYLVTFKLDRNYDWLERTAPRIGLQLLFAFIIPGILAFILADIYFAIFGIRILDTLYLRFDLPVIMIMLLLLNVYYLAFYFYNRWRSAETKVPNVTGQERSQVFTVQKGTKNIPLAVEAISYFYHDGQYNFLRTFEREDFLVSQPLDEVQHRLNEKHFFRVNRQMIVNIKACDHFQNLEYHKLELFTRPAFSQRIVISQKRASAFKSWMNGK